MVHVLKNHIIRFLMQLYASKYIRFLYIITFLDFLLEGLQGFPTLKQIVSLNIGLKRIISDYNQGHIIRELRTRGRSSLQATLTKRSYTKHCDLVWH
jgi:hypothetical protein